MTPLVASDMPLTAFEILKALPKAYRVLPKTRGDCPKERPCPFVQCRYNLASDRAGNGFYHLHKLPPSAPSCVLDVAAKGPHIAEQIAPLMGISQQWIAKIEAKALKRLVKKAKHLK